MNHATSSIRLNGAVDGVMIRAKMQSADSVAQPAPNSDAEPGPAPLSRMVATSLWCIVAALVVLGCLPTLLAFGARWWWRWELLTHFRAYYVGLLLPAVLVCLLGRRHVLSVLAGLCLAINLWLVVPLYFGRSPVPDGTATLRGMVVNVHTPNRSYGRLLSCVRAEDPDILLLIEVDGAWMNALSELKRIYPHRISRPRQDNAGIALLSKLPATMLKIRQFGPVGAPSVVATLGTADRRFTLVGTHSLPPISADNARCRNAQVRQLAEAIRDMPWPVVLMGDLNMTSWSPYFSDLVRRAALHDSRCGFGIQPTWTGGPSWLQIPIDHVLVSAGITVHDRRVGAPIGSDHRPVIVDFSIPPARSAIGTSPLTDQPDPASGVDGARSAKRAACL